MNKNMIAPEEEEPPGTLSVFGQPRIKGNAAPSKHSVTRASEETEIIWIRKNKGILGPQPDPRVPSISQEIFPRCTRRRVERLALATASSRFPPC